MYILLCYKSYFYPLNISIFLQQSFFYLLEIACDYIWRTFKIYVYLLGIDTPYVWTSRHFYAFLLFQCLHYAYDGHLDYLGHHHRLFPPTQFTLCTCLYHRYI